MWAVFDLDGVVADNSHRQHLIDRTQGKPDWDAFFDAVEQDTPIPAGQSAITDALALGWTPIYLSGRPERCRSATERWLLAHHFPAGELVLRPDDDRRPAKLFKRGALQRLLRRGAIAAFVDDDPAVIEMARALGVPAQLAPPLA